MNEHIERINKLEMQASILESEINRLEGRLTELNIKVGSNLDIAKLNTKASFLSYECYKYMLGSINNIRKSINWILVSISILFVFTTYKTWGI